MPTALTSAITTTARTPHRLVLTNPADVQRAVDALADGGVVGHGFANVYAITTRPDADVVQRFNRAHDRPTDWLGSITVPPERLRGMEAYEMEKRIRDEAKGARGQPIAANPNFARHDTAIKQERSI